MKLFDNPKLLIGGLAVLLLVLTGLTFAVPFWNWGHAPGPAFGRFNFNATAPGNWTRPMNWSRNGSLNFTRPNATTLQQFQSAIQSGDYATAQQLHGTYGLGGPLFSKLNDTTFGQYSQLVNLGNQLRQELGLNASSPFGGFGVPHSSPFGFGFKRAMVRHRPLPLANSTSSSG